MTSNINITNSNHDNNSNHELEEIDYTSELERLAHDDDDRDLLTYHRYLGFTDEYIYYRIKQMGKLNETKGKYFYPRFDDNNSLGHDNDPFLNWSLLGILAWFIHEMEYNHFDMNFAEFVEEEDDLTEQAQLECIDMCKNLELTPDTYIVGILYYIIHKNLEFNDPNNNQPCIEQPTIHKGFQIPEDHLNFIQFDVNPDDCIYKYEHRSPTLYYFAKLNEYDMLRWLLSIFLRHKDMIIKYINIIEKERNVSIIPDKF